MRARVEALLGSDVTGMWVSTFHALCARLLRREAPAIGLSRDFVIYDSSDQLTVVKQALKELHIDDSFVQPRAALSRISHAKNRMEGPDQVAASATLEPPRRADREDLRVLPERPEGEQRARLRRPSPQDRRPVRAVRARPHQVLGAVPLRDGGRVSGHQPAAVPPDSTAGRSPPQPVRRRRSRSVDLQVARRRPAQHPRLRAGLRRSEDRQARTQLPLDAGHSRRRVRRHQAEPQPQGQASLDRSPGRRPHHLLPRRRRARGSRLHHAHGADGARRRRRGDGGRAVSDQRPVADD